MALSKLTIRRLTKLADFMDSLPRSANKHFDMDTWFHHDGEHDHGFRYGKPITRKDLTLCGTSACALGWAATIPEFKRAGLLCDGMGMINKMPGDFFPGAMELFYKYDTKTPKQWARSCRKFIKENA